MRLDPLPSLFVHSTCPSRVEVSTLGCLLVVPGDSSGWLVVPSTRSRHGTISEYSWVNHAVGFTLHTAILAPYYAWRETHRSHHRAPMSVERDENYVPRSRSEYGLWPRSQDDRSGAPVFWLMVNGNPALTLTKFLKTLRSMSFRRC